MPKESIDFKEMFRVQKQAEALLKDAHPTRSTRHRLKSVHHLNDHGSTLLQHPLAIIAEGFLKVYEKLRDSYASLIASIFPRHNHIVRRESNSSVIGRLTFADKNDYHTPIHHMHLELWAKTRIGHWIKLSETDSHTDGTFELPFDMEVIHRNRKIV